MRLSAAEGCQPEAVDHADDADEEGNDGETEAHFPAWIWDLGGADGGQRSGKNEVEREMRVELD